VIRAGRFSVIQLPAVVLPLALAGLVLGAVPLPARASNDGVVPDHERPNVARSSARIDEHLGEQLPMDLVFNNEDDQPIALGDAIAGKPTILVPVYYRCPMLCTKVLNGVLDACREMPTNYSIGAQFNVVTVSMDPKEHGALARPKKKAYVDEYGRPGAENGWRFLTGTKESIGTLLETIGFKFEFDKMVKEYDHPTGIVILSPQGKITRYFYGIGYDGEFEVPRESDAWGAKGKPELTEAELRDRKNGVRQFKNPTTTLRLSLIEANDGKGGSILDRALLVCYRYNHLNQGYQLNILTAVRIGGIITLAALGTGVLVLLRRERRKARAAAAGATGATAVETGGTTVETGPAAASGTGTESAPAQAQSALSSGGTV
jgi:protein SCO1/2